MSTLSTRQLIIMIIFMPLVFKMATLPSFLYIEAGTSSYISITIMGIMEMLQLFVILIVVNKGGFDGINEKYSVNLGRILGIPLLLVFIVKLLLYVTETFTYIQYFMFYNIRPEPIIVSFLLVAGYLAFKGAKTIGRLFEISIWFIPIILIIGLVFGKINMKIEYLKTVFDEGFVPIWGGVKSYLLYTLDFTPLLFIKVDNKKHSALKLSVASVVSILCLCGCYMLVIANYARATFLVNEAFANLASFNTVISEIGNLEWPAGLLWISISLFSVSLTIFAVAEIAKTFKVKRQIGIVAVCIITALLGVFVFSKVTELFKHASYGRQLTIFIIEISMPIIMLVLTLIRPKEKNEKT